MSNSQNMPAPESSIRQQVLTLLEHYQDTSKHEQIVRQLQALPRPPVLLIMRELLTTSDLERLDTIIKVLVVVDPHQAVDLLLPLLHHEEASLRWYVCGLLADYGDTRAVEPLVEVLLQDEEGDVRYMAIIALEKVGDERALSALQYAQQTDRGADYEGRRIDKASAEAIQAIEARQSLP